MPDILEVSDEDAQKYLASYERKMKTQCVSLKDIDEIHAKQAIVYMSHSDYRFRPKPARGSNWGEVTAAKTLWKFHRLLLREYMTGLPSVIVDVILAFVIEMPLHPFVSYHSVLPPSLNMASVGVLCLQRKVKKQWLATLLSRAPSLKILCVKGKGVVY
jgi:hypothetical protein